MKKKLQLTPQKYQGSKETTMRNCMPIKWTTWKKWTNSQKDTISQERTDISPKKTIAKINETKSRSFEKIKKIDKPLARLIKKKKRTQISKIRNEKGKVTTDST